MASRLCAKDRDGDGESAAESSRSGSALPATATSYTCVRGPEPQQRWSKIMTTSRLTLLTVSSTLALALMATPAAIDWSRLQPAANLAQAADAIAAGDRASTAGSSHAAVDGAESHAAGAADASPG